MNVERFRVLQKLIEEAEETIPVLPMLELVDRLSDILPREVMMTWSLAKEYLD